LLTDQSLSNPYFIKSLEQTKHLIYAAWDSKIYVWYSEFYRFNLWIFEDNGVKNH
jgi:hypothetical protein